MTNNGDLIFSKLNIKSFSTEKLFMVVLKINYLNLFCEIKILLFSLECKEKNV